MKFFKRTLLLLALIIAVAAYFNYPKLNLISGFAAKNMASGVFVGHRAPENIAEKDNNIPMVKLSKVTVGNNSATGTVFGLNPRKSIFRAGLGCVLINDEFDETKPYLQPNRIIKKDTLAFPFGDKILHDTVYANVDYDKLNVAIENSFADPEIKKTRTVLVYYKNSIIGEKYSDGFNGDSPILGWSMTKSVLATLYGVLEYQNKINLNDYAPIEDWKKDERKNITLNHLLRMQSGLAWEEDYTKITDVTKMLFLASDMTKTQANKEAIAKPTEIWNYSSGTTNLLSGILRKQFTTHQEYLDFPYAELIDKIGMSSMLLEADMEGNYVASSYGWASTYDWAKFGILYLNKGNWNGVQLFDENWVNYITKPTAYSNGTYGAHFWLNANGKYPDVPRDLFSANGFLGQRVFIIPSKDLVIVRTGLAEEPEFNINTFLKEILSAVH